MSSSGEYLTCHICWCLMAYKVCELFHLKYTTVCGTFIILIYEWGISMFLSSFIDRPICHEVWIKIFYLHRNAKSMGLRTVYICWMAWEFPAAKYNTHLVYCIRGHLTDLSALLCYVPALILLTNTHFMWV